MYKVFCEQCYNGERQYALSKFVRQSVAEYADVPADSVVIGYETGGRPSIQSPAGYYLSISHSGTVAAVAVSDRAVGIDIEMIRPHPTTVLRKFTEAERRHVERGGDIAFFQVWCAKEAILKLRGCGLSGGLSTFSVCGEVGMLKIIDGTRLLVEVEEGRCIAVAEKE